MSFKRGNSAKISLNIGQPDYFQKFWEIHSIGFYEKGLVVSKNYVSYNWVIAVYVYSLNDIWDGSISFDVCPIDFSKSVNKRKSWSWRHSRTRKDIGVEIFNTEEEAWVKWHETYKSNPGMSNSRETIMEKRKRHMELKKEPECVG